MCNAFSGRDHAHVISLHSINGGWLQILPNSNLDLRLIAPEFTGSVLIEYLFVQLLPRTWLVSVAFSAAELTVIYMALGKSICDQVYKN